MAKEYSRCKTSCTAARFPETGLKYLRQAFRQIKHRVTNTVRKLRSDYYTSKILQSNMEIPKQVINGAIGEIERICHHGELVGNKALISETFYDHFVSIGEKLAGEISAPVNDTSSSLLKNKVNGTNSEFKKSNQDKCINC